MDNPMDLARAAIGGINQDTSAAGETLESVGSDSSSYLKSILDRNQGRKLGAETPPVNEDAQRQAAEYKRSQEELTARLARLEEENKSYRELSEKQLKTFESIVNRPAPAVTIQQQREPEPLPSYETEDESLAAALNTLEKRMDMKYHAQRQQDLAYQNQQRASFQQRDFQAALKRAKAEHKDWSKYFDEKVVMQDASAILNNPSTQVVDWDTELELAYNAKAGKDWLSELQELRKYKEDNEKKGSTSARKQSADLHLVPTVGGRSGGSSQTPVLAADRILAEARRAGKRTLTPKEFGKIWAREKRASAL